MVDTVEKAIYELGVRGLDQLDRAAQGVDKLAASEDKLKAANDRLAASGEKVIVIHQRDEVAKRTATGGIDRLIASMDRQLRAEQQLMRTREQLTRFEQEGTATAGQLARAHELAVQRYEQQTAAINKTRVATNDNTAATQASTYGMKQLGLQLGDIGTSLASGSSPLRVLAQQGDQVRIAIGQAGGMNAVLTAAGAAIGRLATPSNLAAIGLAAVAGGAVAVLSHAGKLETQAKSFTVALDATGASALATGADFQRMVRDLQAMGIAADQARASLLDVVRVQGINPAAAGRIVATGANIAAGIGGDPSQRAKDLATALSGGLEATIQYGLQVKAIDSAQADLLRKLGDTNAAFDQIEKTVAGRLNKTLSATTRTLDDVKSAFGSMWDAIAVTGPAQTGIRALEHAANVIAALAQNRAVFLNLPGFGQVALNQAAADARNAASAAGYRSGDAAFAPLPPPGAVSAGLAGLKPELSGSLEKMIADAASQGIVLGIGSGLRSTERQAQLYAADLARNGGVPSGMVAPPGRSLHEQGGAADLVDAQGRKIQPGSREDAWLAANASRFSVTRPMGVEPWHVEQVGGRSAAAVTGAPRQEQLDALGRYLDLTKEVNKATAMVGEGAVWWKTYWAALGEGTKTNEEIWAAQSKANQAVTESRIELGKAADTQALANKLGMETARITGQDVVAGYRASAQAQAELAVRANQATDVQSKANEILRTGAVEALTAASNAIPGLKRQAEQSEQLAVAITKTASAEADAAIQVKIAAATEDLVNRSRAAGIDVNTGVVKTIRDETEALIKRNAAAEVAIRFGQDNIRDARTVESVKLQTNLQGQTTEYISRQTDLLKVQQDIQAAGGKVDQAVVDAKVRQVNLLHDANDAYAEAVRQQQRLDEGIRSVASTVENTLTRSIEDAFSGAKVESWHKRLQSMLGSLAAQISDALFIKPLLGSIVGLFSPNAAQGFGSLFGSGGGGLLGGLFGGSSSGTPTLTGTVGGQPATFSLSNLASGASLAKDVAGGGLFGSGSSSGGLFGDVTSWLNRTGNSFLGTGFPVSGLSEGSISSLGNLIGIEPSSLSFLGSNFTVGGGGLLGGTSLTGLLGGAGAGFGAGTLLNSLVGGNTTGGTIGSGLGSLAGAAIGSIIPGIGTLIGGLLGGAGGGLFGGPLGRDKTTINDGEVVFA